MSRYIYQDYIQDGNGVIVASASIVVYLAGTTTLATIYSAESGGSAVSGSTVTSDSNGFFSFYIDTDDYAADQLFKITWSKTGYTGSSFDNLRILWNFRPSALDDYSANDTEFQATVQVGTGASRPTSLQGELTGLRWSIAAISGTNYYEAPTATISEIATSVAPVSGIQTSVIANSGDISERTCDYGADAEASDAYAVTLSPALDAWTVGAAFDFEPNTTNTGACTINPNALGAKSLKLQNGNDPADNDLQSGKIYRVIYDGTNAIIQDSHHFSGQVVQVVSVSDGEVDTGSNRPVPDDDTAPLQSEGDEFMTLAITPKYSTSKLVIDVKYNIACSAGNSIVCALFQDAISECLTATKLNVAANNIINPGTMQWTIETVGTTSEITIKFRAGGISDATLTFNGESTARKFGGKLDSSMIITEYKK